MRTLEATIVSDCGRYKAEIVRRPGGSLEVIAFKWIEEVVPGYGKVDEFWQAVPQGVTITDTLKRAECLALEKLKLFTYPNDLPDQPET